MTSLASRANLGRLTSISEDLVSKKHSAPKMPAAPLALMIASWPLTEILRSHGTCARLDVHRVKAIERRPHVLLRDPSVDLLMSKSTAQLTFFRTNTTSSVVIVWCVWVSTLPRFLQSQYVNPVNTPFVAFLLEALLTSTILSA